MQVLQPESHRKHMVLALSEFDLILEAQDVLSSNSDFSFFRRDAFNSEKKNLIASLQRTLNVRQNCECKENVRNVSQ